MVQRKIEAIRGLLQAVVVASGGGGEQRSHEEIDVTCGRWMRRRAVGNRLRGDDEGRVE